MKKRFLVILAALSLAVPAAAASWGYQGFSTDVQWGGGKGRQGPSQDRGERRRDYPPQQDRRADRDDRRERMSEDDRRALHRDLDKANRELYRRRYQ
ncbi:MAG: hypothetical protein ACXWUH_04315 [Burkholderiales bacterium]